MLVHHEQCDRSVDTYLQIICSKSRFNASAWCIVPHLGEVYVGFCIEAVLLKSGLSCCLKVVLAASLQVTAG